MTEARPGARPDGRPGARRDARPDGRPGARPDVALLFATRILRLFAYGSLAVVMVLYLDALGLSGAEVGLLLSATLIGDAAISLWLTTNADRIGRRRVLLIGAVLMGVAGLVFAATPVFAVLVVAATVGVLSPSGSEVGPFLAVEQASLTQLVPDRRRTTMFAWYQLAGSFAMAGGTLAGGVISQVALDGGAPPAEAYRQVIVVYALVGALLAILFTRVSPAVEVVADGRAAADRPVLDRFGLHRSRGVVARLSGLFAIDSFATGFAFQGFIAFWLNQRFGVDPAVLGGLLSVANLLSGVSALAAGRLAARFGLVRTMVFTHLPANVLLILVPVMPNLALVSFVLLLRAAISHMDVPTRQSYTMAIVDPDERSAAAGVTGIARTLGAAAAPVFAGPLFASAALTGIPFFLAGGLKITYDLLLYRAFRRLPPPEERVA